MKNRPYWMVKKSKNIRKSPKNKRFRGSYCIPPFWEHPVFTLLFANLKYHSHYSKTENHGKTLNRIEALQVLCNYVEVRICTDDKTELTWPEHGAGRGPGWPLRSIGGNYPWEPELLILIHHHAAQQTSDQCQWLGPVRVILHSQLDQKPEYI